MFNMPIFLMNKHEQKKGSIICSCSAKVKRTNTNMTLFVFVRFVYRPTLNISKITLYESRVLTGGYRCLHDGSDVVDELEFP
ncbi:hypothetical protein HanPSC8_Chr10g0429281 [Helianthus annuus]|nr:hypothetical protein HanPSC8_Chr10g0429281 [Helianthus annuus]